LSVADVDVSPVTDPGTEHAASKTTQLARMNAGTLLFMT
jgi:hypothetical protein